MLDRDLAELYQVTTGNLNKAVQRNIKRFPPDFMFQLTKEEFDELKSQLDLPKWNIKLGRNSQISLCIHGTRVSDVIRNSQ